MSLLNKIYKVYGKMLIMLGEYYVYSINSVFYKPHLHRKDPCSL